MKYSFVKLTVAQLVGKFPAFSYKSKIYYGIKFMWHFNETLTRRSKLAGMRLVLCFQRFASLEIIQSKQKGMYYPHVDKTDDSTFTGFKNLLNSVCVGGNNRNHSFG